MLIRGGVAPCTDWGHGRRGGVRQGLQAGGGWPGPMVRRLPPADGPSSACIFYSGLAGLRSLGISGRGVAWAGSEPVSVSSRQAVGRAPSLHCFRTLGCRAKLRTMGCATHSVAPTCPVFPIPVSWSRCSRWFYGVPSGSMAKPIWRSVNFCVGFYDYNTRFLVISSRKKAILKRCSQKGTGLCRRERLWRRF